MPSSPAASTARSGGVSGVLVGPCRRPISALVRVALGQLGASHPPRELDRGAEPCEIGVARLRGEPTIEGRQAGDATGPVQQVARPARRALVEQDREKLGVGEGLAAAIEKPRPAAHRPRPRAPGLDRAATQERAAGRR